MSFGKYCQDLHPWDVNCYRSVFHVGNMRSGKSILKFLALDAYVAAAKIYAPLFFIPAIVLRRKGYR
jgi:hypothetical protein